MKIRIAYIDAEKKSVKSIIEQVQSDFTGTKTKDTGLKGGYLHTVVTIPIPKSPTK